MSNQQFPRLTTPRACPHIPVSNNLLSLNANFIGGLPMQVRPLHDRVLVKRFSEEEKSKGGIIIPDTAKEKPIQGKIIAVGQGRVSEDGKVRPLDVKKGDKVLFGKYAGTEIKIDGDDFLMMREEDILGVLNA